MKKLSREFSLKERILILVLCLLLVAMGYYQFVDQPVRSALASAQAEADSLSVELTAVEAKLEKMRRMRTEVESVIGSATEMGSYNNSKAELALLNGILENTNTYSISFANVTRSGDQIRRSFTLQFTARNYETVQKIIDELARCPYRCLVGNVSCGISRSWINNGKGEGWYSTNYSVNLTATFYETMVGGTPDAGLPASSAA